jgi:ADP-ribosylglycohydrolase
MLGAIVGDVIGSVYEGDNVKTPDFEPLFHPEAVPTDDTVLTCAVAEWILRGADDDLAIRLTHWFHLFPIAGFGGTFIRWAGSSSLSPYNSWGNGSAMRASPVGWAYDSMDDVLRHARRSAEVTHDHPEGIKGAEATAAAVFLARTGTRKPEIRAFLEERFGYDLGRSLADIRPAYRFDVSCQGSVPEAIIAFLESSGFEDAVRKAVSLGGDSDTIACIAGGIAHAAYGVPAAVRAEAEARLAPEMRAILSEFLVRFPAAG